MYSAYFVNKLYFLDLLCELNKRLAAQAMPGTAIVNHTSAKMGILS